MAEIHPRTLLRRAVKQILLAAGTPAGDRVRTCWAVQTKISDMPLLLVYDDDERNQGEQGDDYPILAITLEIEGQVEGSDPEAVEDAMDALALAVQRALAANPTLNGTASRVRYKGAGKTRSTKGSRIAGGITLSYEAQYTMPDPDPGSLDDLLHVHADYDLQPADGRVDAADDILFESEES